VPTSRERAHLMPLSEIKFIDASTISAGVWWTYADRLVLFVLPEGGVPITIFIKNKDLADAFAKSFLNMFDSCESELYLDGKPVGEGKEASLAEVSKEKKKEEKKEAEKPAEEKAEHPLHIPLSK